MFRGKNKESRFFRVLRVFRGKNKESRFFHVFRGKLKLWNVSLKALIMTENKFTSKKILITGGLGFIG